MRRNPRSDDSLDVNYDDSCCPSDAAYTTICGPFCWLLRLPAPGSVGVRGSSCPLRSRPKGSASTRRVAEQGKEVPLLGVRTFFTAIKVIGRLPGEHSCLSLVWAVLDRASAGLRGFTMTPAGLRLLANLRRSLRDPPPNCRKGIRQHKPKPAWRRPILQPSHRITNTNQRSLRQASFTPLLGRRGSCRRIVTD